jgi:hypothetical protein
MSIETHLYFLVKQVHAAWQNSYGVALLLVLDMTGAFDRVITVQLLHSMKK